MYCIVSYRIVLFYCVRDISGSYFCHVVLSITAYNFLFLDLIVSISLVLLSYLIIYIPFQSYHHITIPCNSSHHRVSSYHYIVISPCHTTISSHQHIITLTYHHTTSYHTIIPSSCHTIIPQDTVHIVNKIPGPNGPVKFQQCQAETLQEGEDQRVLYSDHFSATLLLQGTV